MECDTLIILGTAHRMREPGKQSPDGRLKECVYSREICQDVALKLRAYGYMVEIDYEPLDLPKNMQSQYYKQEHSRELAMRVNYVNEICRQRGKENVIYVSIHVDASGSDNKWHDANGWSVRISPKAGAGSMYLAICLANIAADHGLRVRKPQPNQSYWKQNLKVLNETACPAVLTENLFQDNKQDVDYLLSDEGRHNIARLHVEGIIRFLHDYYLLK